MQKVILLLSIGFILSSNTYSQFDDATNKNVIKINPLGFLFGSATLGYERAIGDKSSVLILPSYGGYKLAGFKYTQVGVGAEYRFYLSASKYAPDGFYAAPGISFFSGKTSIEGESGKTETKFTSPVLKILGLLQLLHGLV